MLDKQFRLLREDFLAPLREELKNVKAIVSAAAADGGSAPRWDKLRNVFQPVYVRDLEFGRRPCIMVGVKLPMSHRAARMRKKKDREEYWTQYGRGLFPIDALVCLVQISDMRPISFATVVRREVKQLAEELPTIGLALLNPGDEAGKLLATLSGVPTPRMVEDAIARQQQGRTQDTSQNMDSKRGNDRRGPLPLPSVREEQRLSGVALVQVKARFSTGFSAESVCIG